MKYLSRELSWLDFNRRVLEKALEENVPLLERIRFLAITSSNLDEFIRVRVGSLKMILNSDSNKKDISGEKVADQLKEVYNAISDFVKDQYALWNNILHPLLNKKGIYLCSFSSLEHKEKEYITNFFTNEIQPIISPIALTDRVQNSLIYPGTPYIIVRVRDKKDKSDIDHYAVIPIPKSIERIISISNENSSLKKFITLEEVISNHTHFFFPDMKVLESNVIRLTRNADLQVQEDLAYDLIKEMKSVLKARLRSDVLRIETGKGVTKTLLSFLTSYFGIDNGMLFNELEPIDLSILSFFCGLSGYKELLYPQVSPIQHPIINDTPDIFSLIRERDILLYHPYDSFEPVIRFINDAAEDPKVLAIKQVLYRTSENSPIVEALKKAAINKKNVTVLIEVKARFDESKNLKWASELEEYGVNVIYGVKGYKTHAKVAVVIRKEEDGIRKYCHFGTGNYNEKTALIYSDISFFTSDVDLGNDATTFFNMITGFSRYVPLKKLICAPFTLKETLIKLINFETNEALRGRKAEITAKVNSLSDKEIIDELYKASNAGVSINLNVRGVCTLISGKKGMSENIRVVSIVDRYLEHARILRFYHGGSNLTYISSADWMPRNLEKRLELMIPIENQNIKNKLIKYLEIHLKENVSGWIQKSDGKFTRISTVKENPVRSQELIREYIEEYEKEKLTEPILLKPRTSLKED
ncbi:MAG: polyphosphate kinase 1 [Chitinispirillaceae bacterium]|nr:polyphosphate kinase 1 [Chitinispirillaceae bacterium]